MDVCHSLATNQKFQPALVAPQHQIYTLVYVNAFGADMKFVEGGAKARGATEDLQHSTPAHSTPRHWCMNGGRGTGLDCLATTAPSAFTHPRR